MSTRMLASIGVVLCMAMTSFSIYLGVIEHIYAPSASDRVLFVQTAYGPNQVCLAIQQHNTSTTERDAKVTPGLCRTHMHGS